MKEKKRYRVKEIQSHRESERGRDARERRGKETTEIQRDIERQRQTDRQVRCSVWAFSPEPSANLLLPLL